MKRCERCGKSPEGFRLLDFCAELQAELDLVMRCPANRPEPSSADAATETNGGQQMSAITAAGHVLVDEITERGTHTSWKLLAAALRDTRTRGDAVRDPIRFSTAWEREDYERRQRGEPERGPIY